MKYKRLFQPFVFAHISLTILVTAIILPLIYGIGTAVPVLLVAFLLAYSAKSLGKTYNILSKVEWWARMTTGWIFVFVGAWFSLKYTFMI